MLSESGSGSGGWASSVRNWGRTKVIVPPPVNTLQPAALLTREQAKHAAVLALAATGAAALLALAWNRWGPRPFPRARQSRDQHSPPFAAGDVCPVPSVQHHFWHPDQFRFVTLSHGRVRYILRSPGQSTSRGAATSSVATPSSASSSSGCSSADEVVDSSPGARPVVVLVHGFSIACDIWRQQSEYLVQQGHTVLCFDNYGRGWSDSPGEEVAFDESLYVGQIAELLFALHIHRPVDLIGLSMGGAIVAAFAARYPQAVRRLGLVCPAGLPINAPPSMGQLVALPFGIGERLFKHFVKSMQARGAAAQWEDQEGDAYKAWALYAAQNVREHPGFVRALHRTVLEFAMSAQQHNYAILAQNRRLLRHTLILWGERDTLTPYSNAALLQRLLPGSTLVSVVDAKHNMMIERASAVNEVLAAWLAAGGEEEGQQRLPERLHSHLRDQQQPQAGEGQ